MTRTLWRRTSTWLLVGLNSIAGMSASLAILSGDPARSWLDAIASRSAAVLGRS